MARRKSMTPKQKSAVVVFCNRQIEHHRETGRALDIDGACMAVSNITGYPVTRRHLMVAVEDLDADPREIFSGIQAPRRNKEREGAMRDQIASLQKEVTATWDVALEQAKQIAANERAIEQLQAAVERLQAAGQGPSEAAAAEAHTPVKVNGVPVPNHIAMGGVN
jgi:hypothetical protein